jgi:hypothetical protein
MRLYPPEEIGRPLRLVVPTHRYRHELEPDRLASLTWGSVGRYCSELHHSDEDQFWSKYALDDRWVPPMHTIVSIAGAGGAEREWQEKQIKHSRGDRTGLGHCLDKINHPSWAKKPETLAFALNQKFPGMGHGRKPPQDAIRLFDAMDVIWKRKETSLSERQRGSMRKQLERFRQFGFALSKDASKLLAGIVECLSGDLDDCEGAARVNEFETSGHGI